MKTIHSILASLLLLGAAAPAAKAELRISVDFFHDNLESYGDWREVGDYGYVWQPRDVDRDWRPYSDGRWVYTDAGWTWDSEEPYAWAVYHYGRWARLDQIGWVWVPGTDWGPAWVSWRSSPGHIGWAPLPPEAEFSASVGFGGRVDADYDIGPTNYNFVEARNFGAPRLREVIVNRQENLTIIRQTTNITRITYVDNVIYNQGPQYEAVSRESSRPIPRLKLDRRQQLEGDSRTVNAEQLRTRVEGDSLRVVALPVDSKPATAPRKLAAKVEKAHVDHGWKNAGPPSEVTKTRTMLKSGPIGATRAEMPPTTRPEKAVQSPDLSPVPSTMPDRKGKTKKGDLPMVPSVPVTTGAESMHSEKPMAPEKSSGKHEKGAKPEETRLQSLPPASQDAAQFEQPQKGKKKSDKNARPEGQVQRDVPPSATVEPMRNLPPDEPEAPRQKNKHEKGDSRQKPEQPMISNKPEQVPQAKKHEKHPQEEPAFSQAQQPKAEKGKDKGKDKDKKKDDRKGENKDGEPQ